jgi:tyrosinase
MANGSPGSSPSVVSSAPTAVRNAVVQALVRVRRNVEQADIPALTDAYKKMQARSEFDNRSWIYWSEYHGFNRNDCWHHGSMGGQRFTYDLFLPWHRAYLLYWERVALTENSGAILPWWDWTSTTSHQVGIPASFAAAPQSGPLASGPVPPGLRTNPKRTRRNPDNPARLPSKATIDAILNLSSFEDFSNQVQNQHDAVHGWVGGDMGVIATSAFDPIFWSHHCMIDRLWYLWQVKHGVDNIPPGYLDRTLAPWALTVRDVLDIRRLGYSYGASRVLLPVANFSAVALPATES